MSSTVVSKNTYELLGNDPELDPERATPQQPLNVKTQPVARSGKRTGPDERKADGAFAANSTAKPRDENTRQERIPDRTRGGNRERGARGGDRGGRGAGREGSGRANRDDRHSKTGVHEHQKQVDRSWGANTGEGEFNDETNGLADARKEEDAEGIVATDATAVDAPEPEEDKTVSYEQYLAEQAAKREQFALAPAARAANEGSNVNIPEGKAISRDDEEEELIPAKHKQPRERHRTQTHKYETLDVNLAWVEPAQSSAGGRGGDRPERGGRGGRGGFRGDRADREGGARGSGESRGGRGDGARGGERRGGRGRGDGPPRGAPRGDGASRAPRGGRGAAPNVTDNAAFPALG